MAKSLPGSAVLSLRESNEIYQLFGTKLFVVIPEVWTSGEGGDRECSAFYIRVNVAHFNSATRFNV